MYTYKQIILIPSLVSCSVQFSRSVVSNSLRLHALQPARLLCSWNSPGKNTGVGCHSRLQGIFPTQGSNPSLLHCRQILCQLSYQGYKHNDPLNVEDRGKTGVRDLKMLCCWHCRWRKDHKPMYEDVLWKLEKKKEFILTGNILKDPNPPDVLI